MRCRVCGREGFDICPECSFKKQNTQCWRCRMYIPTSEMQQWKGQWICPNCRMDTEREDELKFEGKKRKDEGAGAETYEKPGRCQRCSRETKILYQFNGRKLCWYCLEDENSTDYSGAGPSGGAIRVQVRQEKSRRKGLINRLIRMVAGGGEEEEKVTVISNAKLIPIKKGERDAEGETAPEGAVPAKAPEKKPVLPAEKRPRPDSGPVVGKEGPEENKGKDGEGGKDEKKKTDWSLWKKD